MKLNSYEKWKNSAALVFDQHLEEGRSVEAQRLAEKVLLVNPSDLDFRYRTLKTLLAMNRAPSYRAEALFLSSLAVRDQDPEKALQILEDLLKQFPDDVNIKRKVADLAKTLGQADKTESLYLSLAEHYLKKGLPEYAVQVYREIIRSNADRFEYHARIAEIFVKQGMGSEAIKEYFELLRNYLDRQMADKGTALLEKMLILDPLNSEAATTLARILLDQGKVQDASRVMRNQIDRRIDKGLSDEATGLNREWVDLLHSHNLRDQVLVEQEHLARALFSHDRKVLAVTIFEELAEEELAAERIDKFLDLMQQSVQFHLSQGNIGKTSADYQRIILALVPRDPEKGRGYLEEFLRELLQRERIRDLDQALRAMAASFEAQGNKTMWEELLRRLAEVYVSIYKLQDAIKVYKLIVEKEGEDPKVYLALGELYMKEENWPLALDSYMEAVRLYIKAGETGKAEEVFNFVFSKDPRNASLVSRMGDIYYALGEWEKALEYYRKALEVDPSFRPAVVGTAMAYAKKGMLDEMVALAKRLVTKGVIAEIIEEYKKALSMNPNPAASAMDLGILYKDLGFAEEAILEFQKASKDPKYFLQAYNQLGLCFKEQGFEDLAIRQYRKALERSGYSDEEMLEIRYNLGLIYEDVKMYREAHELYNDILVVDIGYKDVSDRIKNLGSGPGPRKVVSLPSDWGSGGKKS